MIPSSAVGLVLFIALLAPGLAYVLRHERVVPAPSHTAFRELLRVVFVSVACLAVSGFLFAGLRWTLPRRTLDVHVLIQDPDQFVRGHHVELAWWSLALVGFATLLGGTAADPRVVRWFREKRSRGWLNKLLGQTSISDISAWHRALTELSAVNPGTKEPLGETFVGAQMADGSYIQGYLVSYSSRTADDEQRELILTRSEFRPLNGKLQPTGSTLTILSARHTVRLDVTHLAPARAIDHTADTLAPIQRALSNDGPEKP